MSKSEECSKAGKMSGIVRRVAALPDGASKEQILQAVLGIQARQTVAIPKKVWALVAKRLYNNQAAVVTRGRKGMIKVFSFQNYVDMQKRCSENAKRNKLWERAAIEGVEQVVEKA